MLLIEEDETPISSANTWMLLWRQVFGVVLIFMQLTVKDFFMESLPFSKEILFPISYTVKPKFV